MKATKRMYKNKALYVRKVIDKDFSVEVTFLKRGARNFVINGGAKCVMIVSILKCRHFLKVFIN